MHKDNFTSRSAFYTVELYVVSSVKPSLYQLCVADSVCLIYPIPVKADRKINQNY